MAKLTKKYMAFTKDVSKNRRDQIFKNGISFMHLCVSFMLYINLDLRQKMYRV